jgi:hypothetical protein
MVPLHRSLVTLAGVLLVFLMAGQPTKVFSPPSSGSPMR